MKMKSQEQKRLSNKESQRAFRERRQQEVKRLREEGDHLRAELDVLRQNHNTLIHDNQQLQASYQDLLTTIDSDHAKPHSVLVEAPVSILPESSNENPERGALSRTGDLAAQESAQTTWETGADAIYIEDLDRGADIRPNKSPTSTDQIWYDRCTAMQEEPDLGDRNVTSQQYLYANTQSWTDVSKGTKILSPYSQIPTKSMQELSDHPQLTFDRTGLQKKEQKKEDERESSYDAAISSTPHNHEYSMEPTTQPMAFDSTDWIDPLDIDMSGNDDHPPSLQPILEYLHAQPSYTQPIPEEHIQPITDLTKLSRECHTGETTNYENSQFVGGNILLSDNTQPTAEYYTLPDAAYYPQPVPDCCQQPNPGTLSSSLWYAQRNPTITYTEGTTGSFQTLFCIFQQLVNLEELKMRAIYYNPYWNVIGP